MFMYRKFDLSVYKMSCMLCRLLFDSLTSVIYEDLSSLQVNMELFHFSLMCMRKALD